jgi:predicted phosphodiesterase
VNATDIERLFFKPPPATATDLVGQRLQSSDGFQTPPVRTHNAPYHMSLASVLPERTRRIEQAGRIVFHAVGDTGGVNGGAAQQNVADHMARQVYAGTFPDQPSFFYHLGDVVYYHGEDGLYHDQFYHPYQDYPAPIFAVPGNHDGGTGGAPHRSLEPFMKHFCSRVAYHAEEAGHSDRPTMTQPNCYWRLEAPLLTIVGLYSNLTGELDNTEAGATAQRDWLTEELRTAPADRCLVVCVHHPVYSLGSHGPTMRVAAALQHAIGQSGRSPDLVLSGHEHNYQRFTARQGGREVPYLVVGAGGFAGYDLPRVRPQLGLPEGVKLAHYNHRCPGFLRVTVDRHTLVGEYFLVHRDAADERDAPCDDRFILDLKEHRLVEERRG